MSSRAAKSPTRKRPTNVSIDAEALDDYNRRIQKRGVFSDDLRRF
jgi:hypothetical protein